MPRSDSHTRDQRKIASVNWLLTWRLHQEWINKIHIRGLYRLQSYLKKDNYFDSLSDAAVLLVSVHYETAKDAAVGGCKQPRKTRFGREFRLKYFIWKGCVTSSWYKCNSTERLFQRGELPWARPPRIIPIKQPCVARSKTVPFFFSNIACEIVRIHPGCTRSKTIRVWDESCSRCHCVVADQRQPSSFSPFCSQICSNQIRQLTRLSFGLATLTELFRMLTRFFFLALLSGRLPSLLQPL